MQRIQSRVINVANHLIQTGDTVRNISKHFGVSKSTIHKDLNDRLKDVDMQLYKRTRQILVLHYQDKCYRGGQATRQKYIRLRNEREGA